ncbi:MAG TPA: orotate phosphoribosyltransferase [Alphaproteobacteria bacterium]|nr:orotate phosphoribosyltransferase [Alphaproteobacteria bacterium]
MSDYAAGSDASRQFERLLEILVETSYRETETPTITLSSGKLSRFYIDCKMALSYPEARELAATLIIAKLHTQDLQAVGGLALGAYPIAIAVSDALYRLTGKEVRAFVVRKEPKSHGLQKYLEGDVKPGERVLIVDDVITTGGSTLMAIHKSREAGLEVVQAIAIVDRCEENGRENIEQAHVPFDAIFTIQDLQRAYKLTRVG